ncbi:hypothetical protein Y1Q_0006418 [Alligator mississippiensis]|uniref:Uncharacterized protein n=1 Tax=Alligator mississippiensis TaxID=8496 RepID=A0A151NY17_ALLMI|nr:hypothetical protein Y1Q_0006418 [Alligator mississippiensis]
MGSSETDARQSLVKSALQQFKMSEIYTTRRQHLVEKWCKNEKGKDKKRKYTSTFKTQMEPKIFQCPKNDIFSQNELNCFDSKGHMYSQVLEDTFIIATHSNLAPRGHALDAEVLVQGPTTRVQASDD